MMSAKDEQFLFGLVEIVGGVVGGVHGARLPDLLEPADTPQHRGPAHSVAAGVSVVGLGVKHLPDLATGARGLAAELESRALQCSGALQRFLWFMAAVVCHFAAGYAVGATAGYASHLLLDAWTPEALPLLVGHG